MGHFHLPLHWGKEYTEFSGNGREPRIKQRWFGVTGGFLGWSGTYAERAGLGLNRRGAIVMRLGVPRWDIRMTS